MPDMKNLTDSLAAFGASPNTWNVASSFALSTCRPAANAPSSSPKPTVRSSTTQARSAWPSCRGRYPLYYERDGLYQGIVKDVLDLVTERTGLAFRLVHASTYQDAVDLVNRGKWT